MFRKFIDSDGREIVINLDHVNYVSANSGREGCLMVFYSHPDYSSEFIRCTLDEFMTIAEGQTAPNVSDESANRPKTDPSKMLNGE